MTSLASIITLLQLVLALLTNPATANNPQVQTLATQVMSLSAQALAQPASTPLGVVPTSTVTINMPTSTDSPQPIVINVQPVQNQNLGAVAAPEEVPVQIFSSIKDWSGTPNEVTGFSGEFSIELLDQNGKEITDASATIITDDPKPSGVRARVMTETNGSSSTELYFSSPIMQNRGGQDSSRPTYPIPYVPFFDGIHTFTVSALGSTHTMTLPSIPCPTAQERPNFWVTCPPYIPDTLSN